MLSLDTNFRKIDCEIEKALLTSDVEVCFDFRFTMAILGDASILSGLMSIDPFVKEKQIVSRHSLSVKFPEVVGLRVGLGGAQNLLR